ncbi:TPA: tRNA uridine-5-carboxymethylaminomethyl(34) synthesis GTPase MnmE, partial [Campylobacter coli]
ADIILAIFDNSRKKDEEDENIFKLLSQSDKKIFYLLNKSDLKTQFDKPCDIDFIELSVQNDIQILKEKLEKYLNSLDSDGFLVSSIALINACKISSEAILRAKELLSENSLELFAFELNLAIGELAKFTKDFDRNEILDEMFGNFCLGK